MVARTARRVLLRAPDTVRTRYFVVALMFGAGCIAPVGLALYMVAPDWSLMYLANPEHLPAWIVLPLLLLLYVCGAPAVFLLTARLMREPKTWPLRTVIFGLIGFLLATVLFGFDRLTTVAYYETFHHQLETFSIFSSYLMLPVLLCGGAVGGVLYFSLRHVRQHLQMLDDLPSVSPAAAFTSGLSPLSSETAQVKEPAR